MLVSFNILRDCDVYEIFCLMPSMRKTCNESDLGINTGIEF